MKNMFKQIIGTLIFLQIGVVGIAQDYAEFCGDKYGGEVLKRAYNFTDSLKHIGITEIICLNHFKEKTNGGYSKIIWIDKKGNYCGHLLSINQKNDSVFVKQNNELGEYNKVVVDKYLEALRLKKMDKLKDRCDGWISVIPHFLLYGVNDGVENCLSIPQNELNCNEKTVQGKLIKQLEMETMDFWKLLLTDEIIEDLGLDKEN